MQKQLENKDPRVSVIIPAFNEEDSIGRIVSSVIKSYPGFEVIVVDDGSKDKTSQNAKDAGAHVISHPYNLGNGASVKSGIRQAKGDIFVFMDGDGQHNPAQIQTMLDLIPDYDMVVGARSKSGQASIGRFFGNAFYNKLASYVAKFKVKDLTSGFRAIKADIARSFLYMLPNTYSYPTTITLGVLRSGFSLAYIPIDIKKRSSGKSNIKLMRDGIRFFMIITKICTLYSPLRIFLPVSFIMFVVGFLYYLYSFLTMGRFTNMSALLFSTSTIIFMMGLVSEQISQMRFERRSDRTEYDDVNSKM